MKSLISNLTSTILLLVVSIIIRTPLLSIPFERDEGEFAYFGRLITQGIQPYLFEGNMKLPGAYYFYSFIIQLFGDSLVAIHSSLILLNTISAIVLYLIIIKYFQNKKIAFFSSILYLTLSAHHSILGFALHATQILVPFVLVAFYFLILYDQSKKKYWLILSGLFFAIAVIIKQPALLFGTIYLYLLNRNLKTCIQNVIFILLGFFLPFMVLFSWVYLNNLEDNFFIWVIEYALQYGADQNMKQIILNFYKNTLHVIDYHWLIWISALLGFIWMVKNHVENRLLLLFIVGSILSIVPGFFFRPHYYVLLIPALAILTGYLVLSFVKINRNIGYIFMLVISGSLSITLIYIYTKTNYEVLRNAYEIAPFAESVEIGNYINENTSNDDRVLVFGSEPQIYFYADRRAACEYLYFWPFVEDHSLNKSMQIRAINQIDSLNPKMIVFTQRTSWDLNEECPKDLFNWIEVYKSNYINLALIDVYPNKKSEYSWLNKSDNLNPKSDFYLDIYVRKD